VTVWPTRDLDGTITGASAIVRDISDLKRAERELTQLYEQQRHVALTLQKALMGTPPRIPEIETAHRYLPATGGAGVGGDPASVPGCSRHRRRQGHLVHPHPVTERDARP
jgi:hypothetical protein